SSGDPEHGGVCNSDCCFHFGLTVCCGLGWVLQVCSVVRVGILSLLMRRLSAGHPWGPSGTPSYRRQPVQ
ncbi:hypothetical protein BV22DRAFT_1028979, partial [Leucogyrophana mollusca]